MNKSNNGESKQSEQKINRTNFTFDLLKQNLENKFSYCTKDANAIANLFLDSLRKKDQNNINNICENGIPDDLPILRAYIWKINLGYLPIDIKQWDNVLLEKRSEYQHFKKLIKDKLQKEIESKDYKSKETLEQIIKDVYRTKMQLSFFFQSTNKSKTFNKEEILNIYEKRKNWDFSKIKDVYQYDNFENETHSDVLIRILFTYSYIIKDVSYHQGMNELLAPIYYCYSYDKLGEEEKEADIEADSFWSFLYLMNNLKNNFDNDQEGLFFKCELLGRCLEIVDKNLFLNLQEKNVKNEYFCCRWFIMLFSQEFEIGDILRLWDLILSNKNKNYYVFYISLGIISMKKKIIINGDMSEILQCFQKLDDILCDNLIIVARQIKDKWKNKLDKNIISQSEKMF